MSSLVCRATVPRGRVVSTTSQRTNVFSHNMILRRQDRQVACQGLFGLGAPEIAVIAGVVALIYGPSKLPELGKGLGKTAKSFQTAAKEFEKELKEEMKDDGDEKESKKPSE